MKYLIKDDENNPMRIVGRREEAIAITSIRSGWSFLSIREKNNKKEILLHLPDALM